MVLFVVFFRKYRRPLLPVTILKAGQEMVSFNTHFFDQEEELDELKASLYEQIKRNATLTREVSDLKASLRQSRADKTGLADVTSHLDKVQGAVSSFL